MGRGLIFWRYFSPIILAFIVFIVATVTYLPKYMEKVAIDQAILESEHLALQLKELRSYYSTHVIEKVVGHTDIIPATNHAENPGQIPLPATLVHDLSERYSQQNITVRLYSEYPFPNRSDRVLDEFEKQAWQQVSNTLDSTYTQVIDKNGERFLQVAVADTMSTETCVSCHNAHPLTPKNDWKLGDVRGVLEVTRNLEPFVAYGHSISTNIIIMFIMLLAIVGGVMYLVAKKIYNILKQQRQLNAELTDTVSQLADANKQIQSTTEQLIKSERIALLDNLVVGVSHELSTPLGVSVTAASTLGEEIAELEKLYQEKTLSSRRLSSFIDRTKSSSLMLESNMDRVSKLLASFKHIVLDQSENTTKTINFHEFLDDIVISLQASFQNKDFNVDIKSKGDWTVETCPNHWTQVISILTSNALVHGFAQQTSGNISLSAETSDHMMTFTYEDDGIGMDKELQSKIFQPFFTTKRGQGGTGLGLHVLCNIVELKLNGQISCQSTPNKGTKFVITILLN